MAAPGDDPEHDGEGHVVNPYVTGTEDGEGAADIDKGRRRSYFQPARGTTQPMIMIGSGASSGAGGGLEQVEEDEGEGVEGVSSLEIDERLPSMGTRTSVASRVDTLLRDHTVVLEKVELTERTSVEESLEFHEKICGIVSVSVRRPSLQRIFLIACFLSITFITVLPTVLHFIASAEGTHPVALKNTLAGEKDASVWKETLEEKASTALGNPDLGAWPWSEDQNSWWIVPTAPEPTSASSGSNDDDGGGGGGGGKRYVCPGAPGDALMLRGRKWCLMLQEVPVKDFYIRIKDAVYADENPKIERANEEYQEQVASVWFIAWMSKIARIVVVLWFVTSGIFQLQLESLIINHLFSRGIMLRRSRACFGLATPYFSFGHFTFFLFTLVYLIFFSGIRARILSLQNTNFESVTRKIHDIEELHGVYESIGSFEFAANTTASLTYFASHTALFNTTMTGWRIFKLFPVGADHSVKGWIPNMVADGTAVLPILYVIWEAGNLYHKFLVDENLGTGARKREISAGKWYKVDVDEALLVARETLRERSSILDKTLQYLCCVNWFALSVLPPPKDEPNCFTHLLLTGDEAAERLDQRVQVFAKHLNDRGRLHLLDPTGVQHRTNIEAISWAAARFVFWGFPLVIYSWSVYERGEGEVCR